MVEGSARVRMSAIRAQKVLAVDKAADAEAVRSAFATAVKNNHPDSGSAQVYSMAELKEARDLLLENAGAKVAQPCGFCRGTGYQAIGFSRVPCVKGCQPDA